MYAGRHLNMARMSLLYTLTGGVFHSVCLSFAAVDRFPLFLLTGY